MKTNLHLLHLVGYNTCTTLTLNGNIEDERSQFIWNQYSTGTE